MNRSILTCKIDVGMTTPSTEVDPHQMADKKDKRENLAAKILAFTYWNLSENST